MNLPYFGRENKYFRSIDECCIDDGEEFPLDVVCSEGNKEITKTYTVRRRGDVVEIENGDSKDILPYFTATLSSLFEYVREIARFD